MELLSEIT